MIHRLTKDPEKFLFIFPTVLVVLAVVIYPLIDSFVISLSDAVFGKTGSSAFVGFQNYINLFKDDLFIKSLYITIYFTVIAVFFELIIGMIMALVLNMNLKGSGFARALLIIPWALPGTVVAGIWRFIFHTDFGFINGFLRLLGFDVNILWLSSSPLAMHSVLVAEIWRMTPCFGLLLLSGLSTISDDLYEAGRIDGASGWRIFWNITLPLLKPIIGITLIIRTMFTFQNLEMVYVLTKGGPGTDTYLLPYYTYRDSFVEMHIGTGSSMAYMILFLTLIFCLCYFKFFRLGKTDY